MFEYHNTLCNKISLCSLLISDWGYQWCCRRSHGTVSWNLSRFHLRNPHIFTQSFDLHLLLWSYLLKQSSPCTCKLKKWLRPRSHRSMRYTFCSPPQTRFRFFHATSLECRLWRKANRIAYSEYRIAYTSMWTRPYTDAYFLIVYVKIVDIIIYSGIWPILSGDIPFVWMTILYKILLCIFLSNMLPMSSCMGLCSVSQKESYKSQTNSIYL